MEKFAPLPPPKLGIEVLQTEKNPEDEVYESGKFSLNFVPMLILPKRKGPGNKVGKFHNLKIGSEQEVRILDVHNGHLYVKFSP
jgi:hypothetical protein